MSDVFPAQRLAVPILIEPTQGFLRFDLPGLWHARDLIYPLVRRDFVRSLSQLLTYGVQAPFFLLALGGYLRFTNLGANLNANLLLPANTLHIALLTLGVAFFTSWLTARYRDLTEPSSIACRRT